MPYIVIKSNGQEIERRELEMSLVIGRAPDCDVTIRDILLSRRHCKISPTDDGWVILDLQSKNGTIFNGDRLRVPRLMRDNDVVRLGRSKIIFHAGAIEDDFSETLLTPARPHDPGDSLAGTLSGFQLLLPGEGEIPENGPCPQPRPKDPASYDHEELQTLLTAIASSSWDSVYAEARQPLRSGGAGTSDETNFDSSDEARERRRARPSSPIDFSLQVSPSAPPPPLVAEPVKSQRPPAKSRLSLHAVVAVIWIGFIVVFTTSRKPTAQGSTPDPTASTILNTLTSPDPEIIKAADKELLDSPKPAEPPKMQFNPTAAKQAAAEAVAYLPFTW